jgi:hypothetical protein
MHLGNFQQSAQRPVQGCVELCTRHENGAKLDIGRPPWSYASSIRDKSYRID